MGSEMKWTQMSAKDDGVADDAASDGDDAVEGDVDRVGVERPQCVYNGCPLPPVAAIGEPHLLSLPLALALSVLYKRK